MLSVQNAFGADSVLKICYINVTDPTGINETIYLEQLSVYPNPATEHVFVNVSKKLINSKFFVTDVAGRIVMEGILSGNEQKINLADLNNGIYCIRIASAKSESIKFIKIKD